MKNICYKSILRQTTKNYRNMGIYLCLQVDNPGVHYCQSAANTWLSSTHRSLNEFCFTM